MWMIDKLDQIITANGLGDWASVIGLLISLIGFTTTIIIVIRSRKAAEQTKDAVAEVQREILRTDTVAEFAGAVATMEEIKRLHRQEAWPILPDRYSGLRKSLISIKSANVDMQENHKSVLQNAIQHFVGIEKKVERALAAKEEPSDVARLNSIVSEQIDKLHAVLTEIKTQIGGQQHEQ